MGGLVSIPLCVGLSRTCWTDIRCMNAKEQTYLWSLIYCLQMASDLGTLFLILVDYYFVI